LSAPLINQMLAQQLSSSCAQAFVDLSLIWDPFYLQDPACITYSAALLYFKGYHAIQTHRIGHVLWNNGRKVTFDVAAACSRAVLLQLCCHFSCRYAGTAAAERVLHCSGDMLHTAMAPLYQLRADPLAPDPCGR